MLSVSAEGKVHAAGTDNLVTGLVGDVDLYNKIKSCIKSHVTEEAVGYATTHALVYAPLPCSPSSAEWKEQGTASIRGILRDMLVSVGYGRGKGDKKLGIGPAPVGWPANIDWSIYKGSTRSGLKVSEVTDIIVAMLQAAGFVPENHVKAVVDAAEKAKNARAAEETIEEFNVDVVQPSDKSDQARLDGFLTC